jgi:hypothetical protein
VHIYLTSEPNLIGFFSIFETAPFFHKDTGARFFNGLSPRLPMYVYMYVHMYVYMYVHRRLQSPPAIGLSSLCTVRTGETENKNYQ